MSVWLLTIAKNSVPIKTKMTMIHCNQAIFVSFMAKLGSPDFLSDLQFSRDDRRVQCL